MVSDCGGDGQARGEGPRWDEIKEEQLWEGAGSGGRWKSQRIKAMGSQRKRGSPGPEAGGFPDEEVIRSALKGRWQEGKRHKMAGLQGGRCRESTRAPERNKGDGGHAREQGPAQGGGAHRLFPPRAPATSRAWRVTGAQPTLAEQIKR